MLINKFINKIKPQIPIHWPEELKEILTNYLADIQAGKMELDRDDVFESAAAVKGSVFYSIAGSQNGSVYLGGGGKTGHELKSIFMHFQQTSEVEITQGELTSFGLSLEFFGQICKNKQQLNFIYHAVYNSTITGLYSGGTGFNFSVISDKAHMMAEEAVRSTF